MPPSVADRLSGLDLSLFDAISSQSTPEDRESWLRIQRAIRGAGGYRYLEIGSYRGGSIQPHLLDPSCLEIISIDKRPETAPDDRGQPCSYRDGTTQQMVADLTALCPEQVHKLVCIDGDTRSLSPTVVPSSPELCFIDGEHTHHAVIADWQFCLSVCSPNAAILFHDDAVTWRAIRRAISHLERHRVPFVARKCGGGTFGLFLRDCPAGYDADFLRRSRSGRIWLFRQRARRWAPRWAHAVFHAMRRAWQGNAARF